MLIARQHHVSPQDVILQFEQSDLPKPEPKITYNQLLQIARLIGNCERLNAIKMIRECLCCTLTDAKHILDELAKGFPLKS